MSFIRFGNTRLRSENIDNYGISSTKIPYEKIYELKERQGKISRLLLGKFELVWNGNLEKISEERRKALKAVNRKPEYDDNPAKIPFRADYRMDGMESTYKRYIENGNIVESKEFTDDDDAYIMKDTKYLYVTTYDGSNYQFIDGECSFNIFEKLDELDNAF